MAGSRTYRTKVLVLDKTKLKETDLILTMLDERGRQVRAVAKGARKPVGAWRRAANYSVPSICCSHMDARSTLFLRPSFWKRRLAPRPITRRPAPQARLPRSRACAHSRTPRTRLPLPSRSGRSRLSAVGSTRHIWTCSWRPLSLNFCRTWAIDPIFRLRAVRRPHAVVLFAPGGRAHVRFVRVERSGCRAGFDR